MNIQKAAIDAGYAGKHGRQWGWTLLNSDKCKEFMRRYRLMSEIDAGLTLDYKLRKLQLGIERDMPDSLPEGIEGKERRDYYDTKAAVSAIAEANKLQGHYPAEKHDVNLGETLNVVRDEINKHERDY